MLKLVKTLKVGGEEREIHTDFRVCIDILQVLEDPDLLDGDKAFIAQGILFVEEIPLELIPEAQGKALWFLDGGWESIEGGSTKSGRLYSWNQDLRFIVSATDKVLGYSSRAQEDLHWWVFLGAFSEIEESVFGMLVHQRKLRKTGKQSHEEKEWWEDNIGIARLQQPDDAESAARRQEFENLLKGEK